MNKRKALCLLMAAAMTVSTGLTAYAADTKIDKVRLEFSYGEAPKSGDDIGDITVRAKDSEYYVESAEYTNADNQDTWTVGDVPEVKIELSAKDGYRFSYTSKSHFTLSGCNATFKKAKVYDSGSYIEIYAELKRIGGKLEGTSNLEWEDTVAVWDEIDGAKSYDVKLLRDDKTVTTVSTTGTSYDFAGYFNREGDYTFRVRAIASYNGQMIPTHCPLTRMRLPTTAAADTGSRTVMAGGILMTQADILPHAGSRSTVHGIISTVPGTCRQAGLNWTANGSIWQTAGPC